MTKDINANNINVLDKDGNVDEKQFNENRKVDKDVNANVNLVDKNVNDNAKVIATGANAKVVNKDVNANAKVVDKYVNANAKLVATGANANAKVVITNVKIVDKDWKAKGEDLREMVRKYLESPINSESVLKVNKDCKELTNKGNKRQEQNEENCPKIDNLDASMEATAEMIAKDIAAKLSEPRIDMVVALVRVIGAEAATSIFKETQEVEALGGLMVKNGARRRTAGGTFFQLVREIQDLSIDMEKVNSVFERFNNFEKKGIDTLDRPCDYFNDTGMCKFKSGHFSQSGFTQRIHSCRFCFYRHQVQNSHPESQCRLYQSHLNSIGSSFQSKEGSSNKGQVDEVSRKAKESSFDTKLQRSDFTKQAKESAFEDKLRRIGIRPSSFEGSFNEFQNEDATRLARGSAFENQPQRSLVTREAKEIIFGNKFQRNNVSRPVNTFAVEKIMTGSNALPIGNRPNSTADSNRRRGVAAKQENLSANWSRSTISTFKEGSGNASQNEKHLTSGDPAPSADELSEIKKVAQDVNKSIMDGSGNGHQCTTKNIEFHSFGGEKDMKKAKAKLSMLSDKISKSAVITGHQDYKDKKHHEFAEAHSNVGKSMLPRKGDGIDSKQIVDCKPESQKDKDKKTRKGKCLDKMQAEELHGEILVKDVQTKFENQNDAGENEKKASVKKENNQSLKDNKQTSKFTMKTSKKETSQGTKKGIFTGKDGQEQTQTAAINENKKKSGLKFKEDNYEKSGNKFKETNQTSVKNFEDDKNAKISNQKAKRDINTCNNSADLFGQSKPVAQSPLDRFLNPSKENVEGLNIFAKKSQENGENFNIFAKKSQENGESFNRLVKKSQGNGEKFNRFAKKSDGNGESFNIVAKKSQANGGTRKEALHCPCPPYCPSRLNKVKMG